MKEKKRKILTMLTAMIVTMLFFSAAAHAAAWKAVEWSDGEVVKVGKYWYKSAYISDLENSANNKIEYQRSSVSKYKGFKTLLSGNAGILNQGFATDGSTILYLSKNVLKSFTIKTKKIAKVKTLKAPTKTCYYNIVGFYGGKIWILCRDQKYITHYMWSFDPETKKLKTVQKNTCTYNAVDPVRYAVMSGQKEAKNGTYKTLFYIDKKTGEKTVFAENAIPWRYASGGSDGPNSPMGKFFIYGQYNKSKKSWQIKEYKFATGETVILKTIKKNKVLTGLMYAGQGVRYSLKGDSDNIPWDARMVKAK